MHKIYGLARLTRDPEMRYTANGIQVTTLNLAIDDGYYDRTSEEWVERTIWVRASLWREAAERANERLHKGDMIFFEGTLAHENGNPRVWEGGDGEARANFEINLNTWRKCAPGKNSQSTGLSDEELVEEEVDF
ncbi:MAG: single-stranded DNA-binding protein [Candidatus Methanomethylicaceae archaeon]